MNPAKGYETNSGEDEEEGEDAAASFIQLQIKAKDRATAKAKGAFKGLDWFLNRIQSCFFR